MVRTGIVFGLITQLAVLVALVGAVGLSLAAELAGSGAGLVTAATLDRALDRSGTCALGPANCVTFARAALVGGVAALVTNSFTRSTPLPTLIALATTALLLDAVDGTIARRTGTVTAVGARFDMEVDAFLLFVLSVFVADRIGPWVLMIGAARYLFVVAGWLLPWLREPAAPRPWCKTVAAIQGVVLTVAAANVLPREAVDLVLAAALVLLAESFGRQVWWLSRHRVRTHPPVRQVETVTAEAR
jgi:phosphatidylglycerophosphate synthase